MADGFHDVAGAGFALGANHRGAFGDAAQCFAEVARAAHKRDLEAALVDVVLLVGRRQHFALVDVVHFEGFENARLHEVADARFGHHRNADGLHDLADLTDGRGAGHPAFFADVGRDALQGHHRHRAGALRDQGLLGVGDVHDDAALEHLGQTDFHAKGIVDVHATVLLDHRRCRIVAPWGADPLQFDAKNLSKHGQACPDLIGGEAGKAKS